LPAVFSHLTADLSGVRSEHLRDRTLVAGLAIAAVAGAGLSTASTPGVHERADGGFTLVLLLEPGHLVLHTLPDRGRAIIEVLADSSHDPVKALDVFVRRLAPREVHTDKRPLG
jgi:S-adenosylmethionine/arginine decarboxylase-like enzyme